MWPRKNLNWSFQKSVISPNPQKAVGKVSWYDKVLNFLLPLWCMCGFLTQRRLGLFMSVGNKASTKESQGLGNLGLVQTQPLIEGEPERSVPLDCCLFAFKMTSQWVLACLFTMKICTRNKEIPKYQFAGNLRMYNGKIRFCVQMHVFQRPWVQAAKSSMPKKLKGGLCGD